ncbi:hypothetical protein ALT785_240152 [Alteromonas infernus]
MKEVTQRRFKLKKAQDRCHWAHGLIFYDAIMTGRAMAKSGVSTIAWRLIIHSTSDADEQAHLHEWGNTHPLILVAALL